MLPSLEEVVRSLDKQALWQLKGMLCSSEGNTPFLLQPVSACPTFVQVTNLPEMRDQIRNITITCAPFAWPTKLRKWLSYPVLGRKHLPDMKTMTGAYQQ